MLFRHARLWWRTMRLNAHVSSSVRIRGASNVMLGQHCRIGRQSEINASQGSIAIGEYASLGPFVIVESRGGLCGSGTVLA